MPPRPLTIAKHGNAIVVRGNAKLLLLEGGFRGLYVGTVRGWMLDLRRLPDLAAYLDHRRVPYVVREDDAA